MNVFVDPTQFNKYMCKYFNKVWLPTRFVLISYTKTSIRINTIFELRRVSFPNNYVENINKIY